VGLYNGSKEGVCAMERENLSLALEREKIV